MYKVFYQFIGVRDKYSFCIADSHLTKHSHLYYVEQKRSTPQDGKVLYS